MAAHNLVIVESPAKAKTIKKYLGKDYEVMASMGHVRDLPQSHMGVDIENNFTPKYIVIRDKTQLISALKEAAASAKNVILATDPDREGEAISWHLAKTLELSEEKAQRVVFNEITKSAVQAAIQNPRSLNYSLVDAQQARRILDRIVGYKISPILWKKVKKGLSAGRVQSVAVRIICDREKEILAFEEKEYWIISLALMHNESKKTFTTKFWGSEKGKMDLTSQEDAEKVVDAVTNASFCVENVKKNVKKRLPQPPFITSTMQQEASRKISFASARTMLCAQQLYEGIDIPGIGTVGLITYMRTDSVRIADEAALSAREYIVQKWGEEYLPKEKRIYKNKKNAQDAHEAIRPTMIDLAPEKIKDSLSTDQYKLYKLIWERFMASQMESAQVQTITVDVAAGGYIFRASGSNVLFAGFMTLYIEGQDKTEDDDDQEQDLPTLEKGDALTKKSLTPKQKFTQPPPRYTEATLIKALEEDGIGRPSTYAPTITTVISRGYVEKEKRTLKPTQIGMIVTDLMREHFKEIVDIEFTANMENKLDEIEEGKYNWVDLLKSFYKNFEIDLEKADKGIEKIKIQPVETDIPCEKCGRNMVVRESRYGKFLACPGFPECKNTRPITEETGIACPLCSGKILAKKSQKGIKYFGCENNPKCSFMIWDTPTDEKCPVCGKMILVNNFRRKKTKVCMDKGCSYNEKVKPEEKEDAGE